MQRNESFDSFAQLYDEVRPSYPHRLIEDIIIKTKITLQDQLLELGAGTGKATLQFAAKGYRIHCVELGANLAAVLKKNCAAYPRVTVDVADFEDWQPEVRETFSLIYAAQAFHWLNPATKYRRCHSLLKKDGCLAIFWHDYPDEHSATVRRSGR